MTTKPGEPLAFLQSLPLTDDCILWPYATTNTGYPVLFYLGSQQYAHRVAFMMHRRVHIEETLDHLCHTNDHDCEGGIKCAHRRCVNPRHLEQVSATENSRRGRRNPHTRYKTHCPKGHPYEGENLYLTPDGRRQCRQCMRRHARVAQRRYRAKKAMEESP